MNITKLLKNFPILSRRIRGKPLVYLDNAAAAQKPYAVIAAMSDFYARHNANAHRGIHTLSEEATEIYEKTRDLVKKFLHTEFREEIIFTSGATEGLNLVAFGLAGQLNRGDEILLTETEHHSNIVPWQILAKSRKLQIKYIPVITDSTSLSAAADISPRQGRKKQDIGRIDLSAFKQLLTRKTKVVSVTHASNVTGAITQLEKIIPAAHKAGAVVVVDAAQSVAHLPINVQKMNCDFLVFSGHKMYGPTGIGVLYGKKRLLEKLTPRKYGGHMIAEVTKIKTTLAEIPQRLEGGTMPIAAVAGLGAAVEFIQNVGWTTVKIHDRELCKYALGKLAAIPGLKIIGPTDIKDRLPIFSFTLEGVPAHDLATLLDEAGIAVRSGHHCAQVLHGAFGVPSSTRASLAVYNTRGEIDALAARLKKIILLFHG